MPIYLFDSRAYCTICSCSGAKVARLTEPGFISCDDSPGLYFDVTECTAEACGAVVAFDCKDQGDFDLEMPF